VARGFESKSVESQQADASTRTRTGPPVSTEEAARRSHLATLTLARTRAEADLRAATASAHRSMLENAIADLDRQIAQLQRSRS
jgi:hypothetical protein